VRVALRTSDAVREVALEAGGAGLSLALETAAGRGTTRTAVFALAGALTTSLAGGSVQRSGDTLYTPTYWPAVSWAMAGRHALLLRQSTGVRKDAQDALELLAVRNVASEQCDVEGPSSDNSDAATHRIEWRIENAATPAEAELAAQAFNRPAIRLPVTSVGTGLPPEGRLLGFTGSGVISAVKPADRGSGVIVRAQLEPGPLSIEPGPILAGRTVTLTDAAERDLGPISGLRLRREAHGALPTLRFR
jgi:hypothetical protein